MLKILAVARSFFLVFIVGFTVYARPPYFEMTRTFDEQYARCSSSLLGLTRAVWLAIAWIAFETLIGWVLARRRDASPANPKAEPFVR